MLLILIRFLFREPVDPVWERDGVCCLGREACQDIHMRIVIIVIIININICGS